MFKLIIFSMSLLMTLNIYASSPVDANEIELNQRYQGLLKTLRCVTCQNQNLDESNAPVAVAMKDEILFQLKQGYSDKDIRTNLASKYGDFVLYQPQLNKKTIILWFTPIVMTLSLLIAMVLRIRSTKENKNV